MLAPVNGRDWQFITADSHTAERGPGVGTSPHGTPLEEPIPFLPPHQASSHGKADACFQSLQGKKTIPNQNLRVRAWFKVSAVRERGNLLSQPPTGHGLGSFSRGCVPRTAPEQLQGGQRGSATGGAAAVTPGDLVCLCLEENSPASPAARDKVGVCCLPPPPASRQGEGGRRAAARTSRGRRIFPFPKGFWGLDGLWVGPASESGTRPGQPHRAEMQGSGAVPARRGHAQPLLWLFLGGEGLGRALLLALRARTCRAQHPSRGSPRRSWLSFQAGCSGLGDVSVT